MIDKNSAAYSRAYRRHLHAYRRLETELEWSKERLTHASCVPRDKAVREAAQELMQSDVARIVGLTPQRVSQIVNGS